MHPDDPEHEATPIGGEVPYLTLPSKAVAQGLMQYLGGTLGFNSPWSHN